jgi:hexokinase
MSLQKMNLETFLFGVATGIACVATVQYIVGLIQDANVEVNISKRKVPRAVEEVHEGHHEIVKQESVKIPPSPGVASVLTVLDAQMVVSSSRLQKIVLHMVSEFKKGLASDNEIFKMIPSYVVSRPTGNEKGTFLALDLGGTNFRVCRVNLEGHGNMRMSHAKYTVSDELKQGSGEKLFDFFAECVANFCKDQGIDKATVVPMGFTFSFPVHQTAINRGSLVKWTKGFSAAGVEGSDVVELLQAAFQRKGLNINIKAIVNDTVGTLIAHAYTDPHTYIAVILGTGTNAAYVEKSANIKKWNSDDGEVIINTEWGAYDEPSVLPITPYDMKLDRHSLNPKKQIFEKMISGMYLGELTRLVLIDLIKSGELFGGKGSQILEKKNAFDTAHMSRVERYS